MSGVGFDWPTLKQAILDAHKPIQDMFFKGHGNYLQYTNGCIAENMILNFIRVEDAPVLPVNDSFMVHCAYGDLGELEEEMRRAFYSQFKKDIKVKSAIGVMLQSSFDGMNSNDMTIEQIVHGPPEYSKWENRKPL